MDNKLKQQAIAQITDFIDKIDDKKATLFCYWMKDYIKFLDFEVDFNPISLKKYKRGEIIKAHLGFNIGSEEGGLHYCVVLENNNSIHSPVITVAPLTSVKPGKNPPTHRLTELYIGDEVFNALSSKIRGQLDLLKSLLIDSNSLTPDELNKLNRQVESLNLQNKELSKMKRGSIILLGQITTISKIRIYDPKRNGDVLSKVKLSNITLDKIDEALIKLYTKNRC